LNPSENSKVPIDGEICRSKAGRVGACAKSCGAGKAFVRGRCTGGHHCCLKPGQDKPLPIDASDRKPRSVVRTSRTTSHGNEDVKVHVTINVNGGDLGASTANVQVKPVQTQQPEPEEPAIMESGPIKISVTDDDAKKFAKVKNEQRKLRRRRPTARRPRDVSWEEEEEREADNWDNYRRRKSEQVDQEAREGDQEPGFDFHERKRSLLSQDVNDEDVGITDAEDQTFNLDYHDDDADSDLNLSGPFNDLDSDANFDDVDNEED
jgi:hypothetical protein